MAQVKTDAEIEKISRACRVAADILGELKNSVKVGITTAELEEIADGLFKKKRAIPAFKGYRGYRYATCLSVNEEVVHGLPGGRVLKNGDIIGVDVGAIVDGYYGDNAETFPVGKVTAAAKRLISATRNALYKAIAEVKDGCHLGDVSFVIESEAKKNGFSVVKDLYGHGVGATLHEDPLIPNFGERGTGIMLKAGMTLAIEPMLNIGGSAIKTLEDGWTIITADSSLSAHFEHTILVTKGAPKILTGRDR
ncbi:MAG: type I methionyl aminopeptidase [bacterium]